MRLLAQAGRRWTRVGMLNIYQYVERAIKVEREFIRDRQYVVRDGEIVIVDEFTGRLSEGRKWRDGIHQAVEAKEGVEVTVRDRARRPGSRSRTSSSATSTWPA